jgi:DnaK suppressor protein
MNNKQSREFETKLLEKRRGIMASRAGNAGDDNDSNPEYGRDEGDRANASQAKEMTWLRTSQERGLLEMINAALSRINDGTFGECEHCGQEIGLKRLTAIPWTRYCITCQELLEQYGT